jgi:type IV pilus assembly protein PilQ
VIQPQGDWEFSSYQTERKLVVEVRKAVVESASKNELNSKPQYKGDKLSLNFQNIEVRTVLQVIAEFTGLNIVTSDSVTGNITLRLKDVPWDQALDLILQTKGLISGVTAISSTSPTRGIAVPRQTDPGRQTATERWSPSARKPCAALPLGRRLRRFWMAAPPRRARCNTHGGTGLLSARGSFMIDPKTNTLIINDTQTVIDKIRDLHQDRHSGQAGADRSAHRRSHRQLEQEPGGETQCSTRQ